MSDERVLIVYIRNTLFNKNSFYLPENIGPEYVEKVNAFCDEQKVFENGEFYPKTEKFYFKTYPENDGFKEKNQFFIIVGTTRKYNIRNIENFFDDLFGSFKMESIEPSKDGSIDKMAIRLMIQSFNKYFLSKDSPGINPGAADSTSLNINLSPKKGPFIELSEVGTEQENKSINSDINTSINNNSINLINRKTSNDETGDLAIGKRMNAGEGASNIGNKSKKSRKKKGSMDWWKNLKILFVLSCFICTLGLYISMPFLMNYKKKHIDNNNSDKTIDNNDHETDNNINNNDEDPEEKDNKNIITI